MEARTTTVAVGDVLADKYRVVRVLGRGGMGTVVAATHLELRELRAIKLLHADLAVNAEMTERLMREARVASRLQSPHVARIFDAGRLPDGRPFIVMEHLEGQDLSALRKLGRRPSIEEAALHVVQACDALAEAHGMGLVHRDIKLANLMLVPGPGTPSIKVLDFGVAKIAGETEALTQNGQILGTPRYMAPEQMRGAHGVDGRADLWSLGVVLYVLLTDAYPHDASDALTFLTRVVVLGEPPRPPSDHRSDLPEGLEAIVLRCLERQPERRPASALDLAQALAPFAGVEGRRAVARLEARLRGGPAPSLPSSISAAFSTSPGRATAVTGSAPRDRRRWSAAIALAAAALGVSAFLVGRGDRAVTVSAAAGARPAASPDPPAATSPPAAPVEPQPETSASSSTPPAEPSPSSAAKPRLAPRRAPPSVAANRHSF